MDYIRYNSYSVKARIGWVQKVLSIPVTNQRDKITVKAIKSFQLSHGLVGNGVICKNTFNLLYSNGGSKINIRDK